MFLLYHILKIISLRYSGNSDSFSLLVKLYNYVAVVWEGVRNMNKNIMWIIGAIILVVVGGGLFVANQQSKQAEDAKIEQEKDATVQKEEGFMEDGKMMRDKMSGPRYIEYSKATLDQVTSNRRVLFFFASWCPTCKPADANFKENTNKIPEDLTVIRVNYNDPETDQEEKDLAKKYGITYQHTFVQIDSQGREITKWNGGQIDELLANIK